MGDSDSQASVTPLVGSHIDVMSHQRAQSGQGSQFGIEWISDDAIMRNFC